jgi:hypothetical protein
MLFLRRASRRSLLVGWRSFFGMKKKPGRDGHKHGSGIERSDGPTRFRGAVAQLGERGLCKPEVVGSIPISSTNLFEEPADPFWISILRGPVLFPDGVLLFVSGLALYRLVIRRSLTNEYFSEKHE